MGRAVAEEVFLPLLWDLEIDEVDSIERFWTLAWKRIRNMGTGITLNVLGGIDVALWDIIAKSKNQPLYRLLGAKNGSHRGVCDQRMGKFRFVQTDRRIGGHSRARLPGYQDEGGS
jgi:hypothetical protein